MESISNFNNISVLESQTKIGAINYQVDMSNSIADAPHSILAYYFKFKSKIFNYITVEDVNTNRFEYRSVAIKHTSNFPGYYYAPMTYDGHVFLIGGSKDNKTSLNTCWELDLENLSMIKKQSMESKRCSFGGVVH